MTRALPVTLTNMCMLTNKEGKILVENRLNPNWPGITFPGGHIEPKESLNDAVIREFKEETGLTISHPILCGIKNFFDQENNRYLVLLYQANQFKGILKSSDEGNVFWINPDNLSNYKIAKGFDQIYRVFTNPKLSEVFMPNCNSWNTLLF